MGLRGYWHYLKTRRQVVKTIASWLDLSMTRLPHFSHDIWLSPYMRGFLSTLITRIAQRETVLGLKNEQLGLLQLEAWSSLTGQWDETIGHDILVFDRGCNAGFDQGCQNASGFLAAFYQDPGYHSGNVPPVDLFDSDYGQQASGLMIGFEDASLFGQNILAATLWYRYFDAHC